MRIDLHGYSLDDALDEIMYKLDECKEVQDSILEIIHGYKHGSKIREYIRSNKFLNITIQKGFVLRIKKLPDPGITIIELSGAKSQKNRLSTNYCYKCNRVMRPLKLSNTFVCPKCGAFKKI